jgi:hypothetical protein
VRKELGIMRAVFNFMVKKVEPKELRVTTKDLSYIPLPPKPPSRGYGLALCGALRRMDELGYVPMRHQWQRSTHSQTQMS